MKLTITALGCCLLALGGWAKTAAAYSSLGGNCVLYVRAVTGMEIAGNAGSWWDGAAGRYPRGHVPVVGSVLVFKPFGYMRSGHVAVVSRVLNRRMILVDQANWVPGRVVKDMAVFDSSPGNDWSMVRVVAWSSNSWGRDNPTFGFIYPGRTPRLEDAVYSEDEGADERPVRDERARDERPRDQVRSARAPEQRLHVIEAVYRPPAIAAERRRAAAIVAALPAVPHATLPDIVQLDRSTVRPALTLAAYHPVLPRVAELEPAKAKPLAAHRPVVRERVKVAHPAPRHVAELVRRRPEHPAKRPQALKVRAQRD